MIKQNAASAWVLEGRLHGEKEWGHYWTFTSILIEEVNGMPLKLGWVSTIGSILERFVPTPLGSSS